VVADEEGRGNEGESDRTIASGSESDLRRDVTIKPCRAGRAGLVSIEEFWIYVSIKHHGLV
jgi:hypothetical protein